MNRRPSAAADTAVRLQDDVDSGGDDGRLNVKALDEFSCVRIAYDARLDRLRERYNA